MPSLDDYLAEYEAAHRHPVNRWTHAVGIPLIVASLFIWLWQPWWVAVAMFVVGWIFQFVGHAAEGNGPKFFQGPVYLLIGPVWIVLKLFGYKTKKPLAPESEGRNGEPLT